MTEKPSASESSGPGNENSKSRVGGTCVSAPVCTCTRLGRLGGVCKKNTAMRCLTLEEVTLAQLHVYQQGGQTGAGAEVKLTLHAM